MMSRSDKELIRKYFDQKLSEEERKVFEEKMKENDFADQVAEVTVGLYSKDRLKTSIGEFQKEVPKKENSGVLWRIAAISVASMVLVASALFFNSGQEKMDSGTLFLTYFEPAPNIFKSRDESDSTALGLFDAGLKAYEGKDYSEAIVLFEKVKTEEANASLDYYLAISLMEEGRIEEAIAVLEDRLQTNSPIFNNEMQWYLALAYVKKEDYSRAREALNEIKVDADKELLLRKGELLKKISK